MDTKYFILNFTNFCIKNNSNRKITSTFSLFLSTSLIVLRRVVMITPLTLSIFNQHLKLFFQTLFIGIVLIYVN